MDPSSPVAPADDRPSPLMFMVPAALLSGLAWLFVLLGGIAP